MSNKTEYMLIYGDSCQYIARSRFAVLNRFGGHGLAEVSLFSTLQEKRTGPRLDLRSLQLSDFIAPSATITK
jgi:hypothetical protein